MEPRMRPRTKGQQFPTADLEAYLVAFGDDHAPLKETVRVLDEIITDYIIESCHTAAAAAAASRRNKIKVDDFKFVLRRDHSKLHRVLELHSLQREIRKKKRMFEIDEKRIARDAAKTAGAGEAPAQPSLSSKKGAAAAASASIVTGGKRAGQADGTGEDEADEETVDGIPLSFLGGDRKKAARAKSAMDALFGDGDDENELDDDDDDIDLNQPADRAKRARLG